MIENPFAILERRLNRLETLLLDIKDVHLRSNSTSEHGEQLLTLKEAAELLSLSTSTIYTLVGKSAIPVNKKPGRKRLYFSKLELTEWVKSGRQKTLNEITADAENRLTCVKRKG